MLILLITDHSMYKFDKKLRGGGGGGGNGVVTIIGNATGKCSDYLVKTKDCKACKYRKVNVVREQTTFIEFINARSTTPIHRGQWNLTEL